MFRTRKMYLVVQILGGLAIIAAIWGYPGNGWKFITAPEATFDPGNWLPRLTYIAGWIATAAIAVILGGNALVVQKHDAWLATQEKTPAEKTPIEKRAEQLVADEDFREVDSITVAEANGASVEYRVFAAERVPDEKDIIIQPVRLLEKMPNGEYGESGFTAAVLSHSYSWLKGSDRQFQGLDGQGVWIEDVIKSNTYLRTGVREAPRVISIGLASSELSTMSPTDNERLADARGMNLGIALLNLDFVDGEAQYIQSVAGGYAKPAEVGADLDRQRAAIIIAVHYTHKPLSVRQFVLAMNNLIKVDGIFLDRYSREPARFRQSVRLKKRPFTSYQTVKYEGETTDQLVPLIQRKDAPSSPAPPRQNK